MQLTTLREVDAVHDRSLHPQVGQHTEQALRFVFEILTDILRDLALPVSPEEPVSLNPVKLLPLCPLQRQEPPEDRAAITEVKDAYRVIRLHRFHACRVVHRERRWRSVAFANIDVSVCWCCEGEVEDLMVELSW